MKPPWDIIDIVPTNVPSSDLVKRSAELDGLIAGQQHALSYTDEQVKQIIEATVEAKTAKLANEQHKQEYEIKERERRFAQGAQGGAAQGATAEVKELRNEIAQLKQILKMEKQP